jgi:hypothetical protein
VEGDESVDDARLEGDGGPLLAIEEEPVWQPTERPSEGGQRTIRGGGQRIV